MPEEEFTTTQVPRRGGRDIIDLIRANSGLPKCRNCGEAVSQPTGRITQLDVEFDGTLVEALGFAQPVDASDPDGEHDVTVLAIIVDDDLATQIKAPESIGSGADPDVDPGPEFEDAEDLEALEAQGGL